MTPEVRRRLCKKRKGAGRRVFLARKGGGTQ